MKYIINSLLISSIFAFSFQFAFAQDVEKTVVVSASGRGKSNEDAKREAFRSAIDQVISVLVSSESNTLINQALSEQLVATKNGVINSYTVLNESQLPDGSWSIALKALISVSKLNSFIESKGVTTVLNGGIFAWNIKQQLLKEQSEIKAVNEMADLLQKYMEVAFEYSIKNGDPKSVDEESKNWEIPIIVTATTNKNIDFCASYCINTLKALSLSPEEWKTYTSLNKAIFPVVIKYNNISNVFYLRKNSSISGLDKLFSKWEYYTRLFTVESGMDTLNSDDFTLENNIDHETSKTKVNILNDDIGNIQEEVNKYKTIEFLSAGKKAAIFSLQDKKSLSQIEKITGYKIKPIGIEAKESIYNNKIFTVVQIPAEFPGGLPAWAKYLERNLNRDLPVDKGAPPGKYNVIVSFIVDKNGGISEVNAENDPGYGTAEEAVRVIKTGPAWKPASQNGRNVIYRHRQGITFMVSEE
jgi:hypothetical protein